MRTHSILWLEFGLKALLYFGLVLAGILFFVFRQYRVRVRQRERDKPRARLDSFAGQPLTWTQTVVGMNDYELHAGANLVATLYFPPTFGIGHKSARGETSDGCWMFNSLSGGRVSIKSCDTKNEVGLFARDKGDAGAVSLVNGQELFLVPLTNWMSRPAVRELQAESGASLVRLTITPGWTRRSGTVLIQPAAASLTELPWALILMWYLAMADASDSYTSS